MIPNFTFLGKEYSAYMFIATAGVIFTLFFMMHVAKKNKYDEIKVLYMLLYGFAAAFVVSHLFFGLVQIQNFIQVDSTGWGFQEYVEFFLSGSVYYGGLIGCLIAAYIYLHFAVEDSSPYFDMGAAAIPLFHTFGRIGCFLSGCCYGVEWKHGVTYHHAQVASANGVPRFPVQLVEAILNLILSIVILRLFTKKKAQGYLINIYLIVYPVYRFILEYFRGDSYRGFFGPFSTSQTVSIILVLFSVISIFYKRSKSNRKTVAAAV